jgi:hypothetical protein
MAVLERDDLDVQALGEGHVDSIARGMAEINRTALGSRGH